MDKATKQYRQYIFKVNHKLSRKAAKMGDTSVADNPKVRGMLRAASKVYLTLNFTAVHQQLASETPKQASSVHTLT